MLEAQSHQSVQLSQQSSRPERLTGSIKPTQDVDKQFVQFICEQRPRKAVEVIRDSFEDVPFKSRIRWLVAVVLWP